jgi:hypothetical protein
MEKTFWFINRDTRGSAMEMMRVVAVLKLSQTFARFRIDTARSFYSCGVGSRGASH